MIFVALRFFLLSRFCQLNIVIFSLQVHYYVQSHIQINEYRDRIIFVSIQQKAVQYIVCVHT
jgi:hypothetical protein